MTVPMVCRICALPLTEQYAVTVPVGTEDPNLWRCPAGHIGAPAPTVARAATRNPIIVSPAALARISTLLPLLVYAGSAPFEVQPAHVAQTPTRGPDHSAWRKAQAMKRKRKNKR